MGVRAWYRKRKRSECIGQAHTGFWYDPETGDTWQANGRYALFTVGMGNNSAGDIASMCYHVHSAELTDSGEKHLPEKYRGDDSNE